MRFASTLGFARYCDRRAYDWTGELGFRRLAIGLGGSSSKETIGGERSVAGARGSEWSAASASGTGQSARSPRRAHGGLRGSQRS
ncbi:hypothetical protein NDU88_001428 [Pleurodeles waltl]|uniref:Uncharacterized protein n=1 Tax=Pleurodeles waltl TaxID=8319 RepID=A0AAV7V9K3_PLEWA|nr:hypothetical protein NDU88_001428 [Pleurodeles waltl]